MRSGGGPDREVRGARFPALGGDQPFVWGPPCQAPGRAGGDIWSPGAARRAALEVEDPAFA